MKKRRYTEKNQGRIHKKEDLLGGIFMAKTRNKYAAGLAIGSAAAVMAYLFFNKGAREKTLHYAREGKQYVVDATTFVKDHREEIQDLLKETTDNANALVRMASEDIEEIVKHSRNLKSTATDLVDTAKNAVDEIKDQKTEEDKQPSAPAPKLPEPPLEKQ